MHTKKETLAATGLIHKKLSSYAKGTLMSLEEPRGRKNVMSGFYVNENIHKGDTRFMLE
ncbi:hypothetical protein RO3G_12818 [Rhizopus delemar RA 99-880]|uniref:Uncharacterized protein n=1 Tax=Rhizopus delemar (strain RA 99-880 / ATCC MYA-4621 / FGSC 9543 / NRRL 43880) TaxID=246409 RepID=I1CI27_RHIO9|nr:hypothetical protein RO3G_12818 [Rhizopus delemar RA 99-880]|eukprot:EIE88107.1 hypothetical protein RO3G_12818 [Rhizopus delemar RA 99-880]